MSGRHGGPGVSLDDSGLARAGKQALSVLVQRLLRKLLMKILAWAGGVLGFLFPIIAVLGAALLVVGIIAGVMSRDNWREDPTLDAAWPQYMQEWAKAISDASVNYPDEEPFKTPPALLAAFRMMLPDLETDQYQIDVIAEKVAPDITRKAYPTKKVTTTETMVCDEVEGCHTETATQTEDGEMSLIEQVVAWDGIHHFEYEQKTERHTEQNGDTTVMVEYTYWVLKRQWKEPNNDKIKQALVAHNPPMGSYDNPEELEQQVQLVIYLMNNQEDPMATTWPADGPPAGALPPTHVYEGEPLPGGYIWPMNGERIVTSRYGWRIHPVYGTLGWHSGTDMWSSDPNILAVADGVVVEARYAGGYGYRIVLDHGNGVKTTYNHMTNLIHKVGDVLKQGQVVGYQGNTGVGTGPHLHFEVIIKDGTADPLQVMFPGVSYICLNC